VLDPDPTVADLVSRHIDKYQVISVSEPEQLAEAIALHHPRAVVRNVPPGQQNDPNPASAPVPFIECSLPSHAWVADFQEVAGYLTKPVTAPQLLEQIERLGEIHDVLVVDDDRGFCELVERTLTASGHAFAVRQAYSGQGGLQSMHERQPDLLLLDLIMPDLDGLQVLAEMRQEPRLANVPVLLLTAISLADDMLMQRGHHITIQRPDGLRVGEVLRCLQATIDVLKPNYDERSMPPQVTNADRRQGPILDASKTGVTSSAVGPVPPERHHG
jgi:CheY-like chemotaxis protein